MVKDETYMMFSLKDCQGLSRIVKDEDEDGFFHYAQYVVSTRAASNCAGIQMVAADKNYHFYASRAIISCHNLFCHNSSAKNDNFSIILIVIIGFQMVAASNKRITLAPSVLSFSQNWNEKHQIMAGSICQHIFSFFFRIYAYPVQDNRI